MTARIPWGSDFATLVERFGERTAIATPEGDCTFAELFGRAAAVAGALTRAGIQPGQPVATFLRNSRQAVWAGYGVTLTGACETALNANLAPAEVAYCVDLAGVKHAVTDVEGAARFQTLGCHRPHRGRDRLPTASNRPARDNPGRCLG